MSAEERPPEAEFREYTRGRLPNQDEPEVHPWTGLIADPRVRAYLDYMARIYDPDWFDVEMPQKFSDTQYCKDIIAKYSTESGTQSLLTGNVGHLNFYSGLVGYETDVSGMKTLMNLQQMMEQTPVWICYIYGLMGSGKTDFAFLLLEVMQSVWSDVYLMANIDSKDVDETNKHYSRIVSLLEERREKIQNGEDLEPVAILLDEAAQLLSGSGADQHRAKELAKLLKLARKSNAHVIMIGQDGKDIGPSLRALCTIFVHKKNQKTATLFRDVKDREGIDAITTLNGVPPTDMDYSTWDEGEFIFDDAGEDDLPTEEEIEEMEEQHEREMMAMLAATSEMTNIEIADLYDVSESTVRRASRKYEDKLEELGLIGGE